MMVNTGIYQMTDILRVMMHSFDWTMVCVNHVALFVTHGRNSSEWKCEKALTLFSLPRHVHISTSQRRTTRPCMSSKPTNTFHTHDIEDQFLNLRP